MEQGRRISRRTCVAARASAVRARWCIDAQYGHKQALTGLLQEWVSEVGSKAGLVASNTRLSSGSVGVAESRLELEVTFASLAEWEQFLAAIPAKEHRAWSQRVASMVVGGSPRWELFRAVPAFPEGQGQGQEAAPAAQPAPAARPMWSLPSETSAAQDLYGTSSGARGSVVLVPSSSAPSNAEDSSSSGSAGSLSFVDNAADAEVILDWKGEPMRVNPGDKLPFKFL